MSNTKDVNAFKSVMYLQKFEYDIKDNILLAAKELLDAASDQVCIDTINELVINNNPIRLDNSEYQRLVIALRGTVNTESEWQLIMKSDLVRCSFEVKKLQNENNYWDANFKGVYANE